MDLLRDPVRDGAVRSALLAAGLKCILAWNPEDIVMLSGSHPCFGMDLCLYPAVGRPILYAPRGEPDDALPLGFTLRRFNHRQAGGTARWDDLAELIRADLRELG